MMDFCGTDQIFPIHAVDDYVLNRSMVVAGFLRYSALLDGSKLRDSLITLLHTGDWQKLRGRLRFNASSSPMPCATGKPTCAIQPAIADIDKIATGLVLPDWPRSLAEFAIPQRDEPIIGLHILSFSDTTLVVLTFSHVLMDGGCIASFFSAWSSVVASA
ncbi:hypothetical protein S40285_09788 [Stachybotrys chlorohalonatus IBT 40285]|uniref:Condensation domain-containing protein n=1 Tax=Stachybotrys chlorohalonatus (strain IBT 40285) TaxID=1283841 RepID=A0A084Q894_STAC4|nr:hypothetical protein S40285_09788 [Stachybotrys chlorohalonata IBT 40285]